MRDGADDTRYPQRNEASIKNPAGSVSLSWSGGEALQGLSQGWGAQIQDRECHRSPERVPCPLSLYRDSLGAAVTSQRTKRFLAVPNPGQAQHRVTLF